MHESDKELAGRIVSAEAAACEELIHITHAALFRFSCHLTGDAGAAEELVVETFATAWEKMSSYDGRSSLLTWLSRIAYRRFLDTRKRYQRVSAFLDRLANETTDSTDVTPIVELMKSEDSAQLWQAVATLGPEQRIVVMLHYREGMSFREIAAFLENPIGTIKWRISEALIHLRVQLSGDLMQYETE